MDKNATSKINYQHCAYTLYALVTQATTYGMFLQPGGDAYKFSFRLRVFIKTVELSGPIMSNFCKVL